MKTIEGHDVKIFTDNIENTALEQIGRLMSIGAFSGCKVRIMPDVHAGAGCVIGFTGDLGDKVIPNIVGVDIGCGMLVQPFDCSGEIDFHALNEFILNNIPSGRGIRDKAELVLPQPYMERYGEARELIKTLRCFRDLKDSKRLYKAAGSRRAVLARRSAQGRLSARHAPVSGMGPDQPQHHHRPTDRPSADSGQYHRRSGDSDPRTLRERPQLHR